MIEITPYRNDNIAVFGLGKTGRSVIEALHAGHARIYAWDDNTASREALFADNTAETILLKESVHLQPPETFPWDSLKALVLSPGIPLTHPKPHPIVTMAQQVGCPVIADIELLYQTNPRSHYIGITGTNGKSTTTTLIGHIFKHCQLRHQVGGNLGTPVMDLDPLAEDGTYILELSSFQIDLLDKTACNTAILLNISPDHLDRHGTIEHYCNVKKRIFTNQAPDSVAIIGVDDAFSKTVFDEIHAERQGKYVIPISCKTPVESGVSVIDNVLYDNIEGSPKEYSLGTLPYLLGSHNQQNIAAAYAACRHSAMRPEAIIQAIQSFTGLIHRLQHVSTLEGITFINDSKATNADSTAKALEALDTVFWIAGGRPKEGGIHSLEPYFSKIQQAFLIGEAQDSFSQTLGNKVSHQICGDLDTAFKQAHAAAKAFGKPCIILFSPACASFDQYQNFEQRGEAFCKLVAAMSPLAVENAS